jgi:hypothetical protein
VEVVMLTDGGDEILAEQLSHAGVLVGGVAWRGRKGAGAEVRGARGSRVDRTAGA